MLLLWPDDILEESYCYASWVGCRWQDIGDTLTLHLRLSSRLMREGDALFLAGHPVLTQAPQSGSFCGWWYAHFHPYWCMREMHLFWLDIFYLLALCPLGGPTWLVMTHTLSCKLIRVDRQTHLFVLDTFCLLMS